MYKHEKVDEIIEACQKAIAIKHPRKNQIVKMYVLHPEVTVGKMMKAFSLKQKEAEKLQLIVDTIKKDYAETPEEESKIEGSDTVKITITEELADQYPYSIAANFTIGEEVDAATFTETISKEDELREASTKSTEDALKQEDSEGTKSLEESVNELKREEK